VVWSLPLLNNLDDAPVSEHDKRLAAAFMQVTVPKQLPQLLTGTKALRRLHCMLTMVNIFLSWLAVFVDQVYTDAGHIPSMSTTRLLLC
jgi:hypothetical protein